MEVPGTESATPPNAAQVPPPPAPPPAPPSPSVPTGGVGVAPPGTPSPAVSPAAPQTPAAPQLPPDVQAQLDRYRAMEREYNDLSQHRHLIPLGMEAYRRAQQAQPNAAAAPQPAAPTHPWGLPQFDRRLLDFVGKDPSTGELVLRPGAPPDALIKVQEYQHKLQQAQTEFYTDPEKALAPIVEKMFAGLFEKQFGERYGQIQQAQASQRIVQENSDWLFARDAAGNAVTKFNPATGRHDRVLSPYGEQYTQLVRQAQQWGVADPTAQHEFAVTGLQNMLYQQRFTQQQAQATGQQQQQQVVQQGNQTAAQALNANNPAATPPPAGPVSLRDRLRQEFERNGITDAALEQQVARAA